MEKSPKPDLNENSQEQLNPQLIEAHLETILDYKESYIQALKESAQLAGKEFSEDEVQQLWEKIHMQKWKEMINRDNGRPPKLQEFWCVDGKNYLGKVQYKKDLSETEKINQGNIGYEVAPSARRKGIASFMITEMLQKAKADGLAEVMVACDSDNQGSIGVIEKVNGEMVRNHIDIDGVVSNVYLIKL